MSTIANMYYQIKTHRCTPAMFSDAWSGVPLATIFDQIDSPRGTGYRYKTHQQMYTILFALDTILLWFLYFPFSLKTKFMLQVLV
jgi:hypothetical protein